MVEHKGAGGDSHPVPTFADLLSEYRDRTGASYDDMSASVDGAITAAWFEVLHKNNIKSFPRNPATVEHLADLLQVPISTILLAYAATLGIRIERAESHLALSLPPGSDILDSRDVEAVRAIIRRLVDARRMAAPPLPGEDAEALRLDEDETNTHQAQANRNT